MKHIFLVLLIIGIGILTHAQTEYEVSTDTTYGPSKMLKGKVKREMLENDTAFKWFHENLAGYTPNTETVSILKAKGGQVHFLVFGGTWCGDTQELLPKFFALTDAADYTADQITFIAVDRHKKSLDHLPEDMHLTNTPTFIVLKGGKEVGRVLEHGKNGQWEREIAEIVTTNF
jgi:thiol-disulfide isomerase/thioredoxin